MPIFRLAPDGQERLVDEPETGMGFQVVWGDISPNMTGRFVILDSLLVLPARSRAEFREVLAELSELESEDIEDVQGQSVQFVGAVRTIESRLPSPQVSDLRPTVINLRAKGSLFRKTALVITRRSSAPEAFLRFSTRRQDPRVDPKTGNFAPGTYAAPWSEAPLVPSGFAAVGRYALPNPFAARRLYPIVTMSTPQLIGAAAPNYGQSGGGVEVLFPNGAIALYGQPHLIAAF